VGGTLVPGALGTKSEGEAF